MKSLHSARLTLRPYRPEDLERFIELVTHPEVIRFTGEIPDRGSAEAWFSSLLQAQTSPPDWRYNVWAVTLRARPEELIGHCELLPSDYTFGEELQARLFFSPQHWGKGYGSEVSQLVIAYGLEDLGLDAVVAAVGAGNAAALRVLEKAGMQLTREIESDGSEKLLLYSARRI